MQNPTLTMIPGPTPVDPKILDALAQPTVSHVAPAFVQTTKSCLRNLKQIVRTETAHPFVVAGAGTLAMEMALVNFVASDESLLVVSQGFFGDRWAQIAEAFGIRFELIQAEWGQVVSPEEVQRRVAEGSHSAVAMTHVDTSTGAAAPIAEYCRGLAGGETLLILDGVCATAGMDERFDEWGLDVLLTGAQKAFGVPPGVAILLASQRAMRKREGRSSVHAYYADLLRWKPIMEDPGKYFSTPPVNEIMALHVGTEMVLSEGLDARFERHARIATSVRAGLAAVGLELFTDESCLADTLTVARYPEGIDDATFRAKMVERGVVIAPALGPIAGKACRIGHMGNIGDAEVTRLLETIEASLAALGQR
jgi:alanine-glyoxylate transaminase/serine-glyoxylate transaminase/serine-pyruvate transaminase